MKIHFSPTSAMVSQPLDMLKAGDTITINGAVLDYSGLDEGQSLPSFDADGDTIENAGHPLVKSVQRVGGNLVLTVSLQYTEPAPEAVRFPEPVEMEGDGPVPVPET